MAEVNAPALKNGASRRFLVARRKRQRSRRVVPQEILVLTTYPLDDLHILWQAMEADPAIHLFRTDWSPQTFDEFVGRLGKATVLLVGMVNGKVAGGCWLHHEVCDPFTRVPLHCHVDLYILPEFRGAATVRLCAVFRHVILERFGFQQFFATVRTENTPCQHLAHAVGMTRIGVVPAYLPVDGRLRDAVLYVGVPAKEA